MARSTIHNGLDPLYIGLPGPIGTSVGVGDLNAKGNALATIITLRHSTAPPICMIQIVKIRAPNKRFDMIPKIAEKCKCFFGKFFVFQKKIAIMLLYSYNTLKNT